MFGLSKKERDAKKRELEIKQLKTSVMSSLNANRRADAIKTWRKFTNDGLKRAIEVISSIEAGGDFPDIQ